MPFLSSLRCWLCVTLSSRREREGTSSIGHLLRMRRLSWRQRGNWVWSSRQEHQITSSLMWCVGREGEGEIEREREREREGGLGERWYIYIFRPSSVVWKKSMKFWIYWNSTGMVVLIKLILLYNIDLFYSSLRPVLVNECLSSFEHQRGRSNSSAREQWVDPSIKNVLEFTLYTHSHSTQDSVIYPRLVAGEPFAGETERQLEYFAVDGLRTLCIAQATIDKTYYDVPTIKFYKYSTICTCVCIVVYCVVVVHACWVE